MSDTGARMGYPLFLIDQDVTIVTYTAQSLIQTIAQIGGLFILFRVSLLLTFAHRSLFDREIRKESEGMDHIELFTFENYKNALLEIEAHKQEIYDLKLENKLQRNESEKQNQETALLSAKVEQLDNLFHSMVVGASKSQQ